MTSVLFESHQLYYLPHFLPIVTELRRRKGYQLAASIPKTIDSFEQKRFARELADLKIEFITGESEAARTRLLQGKGFDVIIVGNVGRLPDIAADHSLVVMVYHGIGLKQTYYRDTSPRVDLRAVECRPRLEELEQQGVTNGVLTGFTKLDFLAQDDQQARNRLVDKLGLDSRDRVVLYAPTFYPTSLDRLLPFLPRLAEQVNIIVKLHNFSWFQKRYRYQSQLAAETARRHPRIHLVPPEDYDILPYYRPADALISDLSSTLFEFLALDRPIIKADTVALRLKHRLFPWRIRKRIDHQREAGIDFAYHLDRPDQLSRTVDRALRHPDEMALERKAGVERYLYRIDGQASSRLIDAVEAALKRKGWL